MTDWKQWKVRELKQYLLEHDPSAMPAQQRPTKAELVEAVEQVHQRLQRRQKTKQNPPRALPKEEAREPRRPGPRPRQSALGDERKLPTTRAPRTPKKAERQQQDSNRGVGKSEAPERPSSSESVTATSRKTRQKRSARKTEAVQGSSGVDGSSSGRKRVRRSPLRGEEARRRLVGDDIPEDRSPDGGAWAESQHPLLWSVRPRSEAQLSPASLIQDLRRRPFSANATSTRTSSPDRHRSASPRASSTWQDTAREFRPTQQGRSPSPTVSASNGAGPSTSSGLGLREALRDVLSMVKSHDQLEPMEYVEYPEQVLPAEAESHARWHALTHQVSAVTPEAGDGASRSSLHSSPVAGRDVPWLRQPRNAAAQTKEASRIPLLRDTCDPLAQSQHMPPREDVVALSTGSPGELTSGGTLAGTRSTPTRAYTVQQDEAASGFMTGSMEGTRLASLHEQVSAVLERIRAEQANLVSGPEAATSTALSRNADSLATDALHQRLGDSGAAAPAVASLENRSPGGSAAALSRGTLAVAPEPPFAQSPLQAFRTLRQHRERMPVSSAATSTGSLRGRPVHPLEQRSGDSAERSTSATTTDPTRSPGAFHASWSLPSTDAHSGDQPSISESQRYLARPETHAAVQETSAGAPGNASRVSRREPALLGNRALEHRHWLRSHWRVLVALCLLLWFAVRIYLVLPSIPFCDSSESGSGPVLGCRPCPEHGICVGGVLTCRDGYVVLGSTCAPDRDLNRYAHIIQGQVHRLLGESAGRYRCGERAIRWKWTERELREALEQHPYMERLVRSSKWKAAFRRALDTLDDPVVKQPRSAHDTVHRSPRSVDDANDTVPAEAFQRDGAAERPLLADDSGTNSNSNSNSNISPNMASNESMQPDSDATQTGQLADDELLLYWSTDAQRPMWCRLWQLTEAHLGSLIWLGSITAVTLMFATTLRRKRLRQRQIRSLQQAVHGRLQEQKRSYLVALQRGRSDVVTPFLIDVHLRDELLGDIANIYDRQRLWDGVSARARTDSRLQLRSETFTDGRRALVWEWTGPLGSAENAAPHLVLSGGTTSVE